MKISLNWLQDFITLRVTDPQEIARRVTAGVAEVDEVEILGGLFDNCCVGKILSLEKHPNADRLNICQVHTDSGKKTVVCGGTNLRKGMRVAFAHVGARVRHGEDIVTLTAAKIRGVESQGMICAAEELDLQTRFPPKASEGARAIVDFGDSDEGVGLSLKEFLGLDDVVLHIDNHAITHRADLFSHVGFAREFVALGLAKWKVKNEKLKMPAFPKMPIPIKCVVDCKDLVPRYSACLLEIDGLGETPRWMRKRLEATGWRCVSLPVDITNYVAMEIGMPLHCFDADDIRGTVHFRKATKGESITTLDGIERPLPEGVLVLSDDEGVFDLLGIMGGLRSSTKESTRRCFIQAAIIDPASIRRAIIGMGHRTDASTVYEKGVPREASSRGLLRAVELFAELVPGCRIVSQRIEWGDDGKAKPITVPLERVTSVLGVEVPEKKIVKILEDLEFSVKKKSRNDDSAIVVTVTPPLHRLGDIRGAHDVIEEIGRVYGYDAVPSTLPLASIAPPPRDFRLHALRDGLAARGYVELQPLSLLSERLLRRSGLDPSLAVAIQNPLGEELKHLYTSVLPGLLEHAEHNMQHAQDVLRTFTYSHVFTKGKEERMQMGIFYASATEATDAHRLLHEAALLLKRDLRTVLARAGMSLEVAPGGDAGFAHPGRSAELFVKLRSDRPGASAPLTPAGILCELHPSVTGAFGLPHRAAVALLDLQSVLSLPQSAAVASSVPEFPAVAYDVTIPMRITEQAGDLLKRLRGSHALLERVDVKDLYVPSHKESELYNLTLTFTYRAADRTLTESEVQEVHGKVVAGVAM